MSPGRMAVSVRSSTAETSPVAIRTGKGGEGLTPKAAKVIRALMPIRDAVREVLRAQAAGRPWMQAQIRLRTRLFDLHPLPWSDQPHRRHCHPRR